RGSLKPARERRMALATMRTASSWPMTRFSSASSMRSSFSFSPSSILLTGMPVHLDTTSAISSSVTLLRTSWGVCDSALCLLEAFFQLRDLAVLQFGHARQIAGAARAVEFDAKFFQLLFDFGGALERGFFRLPD